MPDSNGRRLLTVNDIMKMCGISRRMATKLIMDKGCPKLPHNKGEKIYVTEAGWNAYMAKFSELPESDIA